MATPSMLMGPKEWGLLLALSGLWGGSFFFVGVAVQEVPPISIVMGRVGIAAVTLWVVIGALGIKAPKCPRHWVAFAFMGLLNNAVPFCLIVWGQTQITSGLAAILNATTPVWTVLLAHVWTADEKLTPVRATGVGLGLLGAVIVIGPASLLSLADNVWAQLAVLGAAISYAFAGLFGRRFKGQPPMVTAAGQVTTSALLLMPLWLWVDRPWQLTPPSMDVIAAIIALAVLSTALAYAIYFRILAVAGATNLLLVTFLIPVSAILLGALFLNEVLNLGDFIGMGVIGLGLAAIDGRPISWAKRQFRPKTSRME